MKKFLAALLILCMIPAVCSAIDMRPLWESLFDEYRDFFKITDCKRITRKDNQTVYSFDWGAYIITFNAQGGVISASMLYYNDIDTDFIDRGLCMTYSFFGQDNAITFYTALDNYWKDKGYCLTDDASCVFSISKNDDGTIFLTEIKLAEYGLTMR